MKKPWVILLAGLVLFTAAFSGFYYLGTASCRAMLNGPQPELAWLKKEFRLSDAEFARIIQLHEAYLPKCAERCSRIAALNGRLQQLLSQSPNITPELREILAQRAQMRADCEAEMLNHFLEISRTMPPAQGQRYLQWVEQQTFLSGEAMESRHHPSATSTPHPHSMADHQM